MGGKEGEVGEDEKSIIRGLWYRVLKKMPIVFRINF